MENFPSTELLVTVCINNAQNREFFRSVSVFPWNGCSHQCEGELGLCRQVLGEAREQLEQVGHAGACADVGRAESTS